MSAVQADDKQDRAVYGKFGQNHGNLSVNAQANANWKAECGSCHIAFEPGLLPYIHFVFLRASAPPREKLFSQIAKT